MNKRKCVQQCALETGLTQNQVNNVLNYFIKQIKNNLINGCEIGIPGIGKIIPTERKINGHSDPFTNQYHEGHLFKTIRMKVSPSFKEILNS